FRVPPGQHPHTVAPIPVCPVAAALPPRTGRLLRCGPARCSCSASLGVSCGDSIESGTSGVPVVVRAPLGCLHPRQLDKRCPCGRCCCFHVHFGEGARSQLDECSLSAFSSCDQCLVASVQRIGKVLLRRRELCAKLFDACLGA